MLDGCGVQRIGQLLIHLLACGAVVVEDAHLDESMGLECGIDLLLNGGRKSVATDQDHGVQMVGIGAVFPALGGSQLNLRHTRIISTPRQWPAYCCPPIRGGAPIYP